MTEPTYLYAITDRCESGEQDLGLLGLDGLSPARVVAHAGLGCVVSSHLGDDPRTVARDRLFRHLLRHQQIVEAVMRERTVLPVKFGTIVEDPSEIALFLEQARDSLAGALESARGKIEVEVAATWDLVPALEAVRRETVVAGAIKVLAAADNPSTVDKVRLGRLVKVAMDCRKDTYREMILARLGPLAHGVVSNALLSEELIMNVAFLIDRARQREFDRQILELDRLTGNEIRLRTIGPLPPYSFHTVDVRRVSTRDVEKARAALGLSGVESEQQIRLAYRNLLAKERRGIPPSTTSSPSGSAELRQAAEVLRMVQRRGLAGGVGPYFAVSIGGVAHHDVAPARFGAPVGA